VFRYCRFASNVGGGAVDGNLGSLGRSS
jgi:hypothetical protein